MAIIPDHIDNFHGHMYDFGSASNLSAAADSEVVFDNTIGYNHIGFKLTIPPGGVVTFQATYDDSTYFDIKLKNESLKYVSSTSISGRFRGVISAYRKIKFKVTTAGSSAGSVIGRATMVVPSVEDETESSTSVIERDKDHQVEVVNILKRLLAAQIITNKQLELLTDSVFRASDSEILTEL